MTVVTVVLGQERAFAQFTCERHHVLWAWALIPDSGCQQSAQEKEPERTKTRDDRDRDGKELKVVFVGCLCHDTLNARLGLFRFILRQRIVISRAVQVAPLSDEHDGV